MNANSIRMIYFECNLSTCWTMSRNSSKRFSGLCHSNATEKPSENRMKWFLTKRSYTNRNEVIQWLILIYRYCWVNIWHAICNRDTTIKRSFWLFGEEKCILFATWQFIATNQTDNNSKCNAKEKWTVRFHRLCAFFSLFCSSLKC